MKTTLLTYITLLLLSTQLLAQDTTFGSGNFIPLYLTEVENTPFVATGTSMVYPAYSYEINGQIGEEIAFENWILKITQAVVIGQVNSAFAYRVKQPAEDLNIFIRSMITDAYIYNQHGQFVAQSELGYQKNISVLYFEYRCN